MAPSIRHFQELSPTLTPRMVAPASKKSSMLLVRLKGPVSHFPFGMNSTAFILFPLGPLGGILLMVFIARRKTLVLRLLPSPIAPKLVMLILRGAEQ